MAEYNVKINVKTDTGYDQLYPKSKSDIIDFDKTSSNLSSTNVEAAIKEVNTKANTNKTNIGILTSLTTNSKTNLVGAINEVDSHANTAQSTANTNKTNIGTLSSLKTTIKTSIVNAINWLYDNVVRKANVIDSLDDILANQANGMVAGAKAVAELNSNISESGSWELIGTKINRDRIYIDTSKYKTVFCEVRNYEQYASIYLPVEYINTIDSTIEKAFTSGGYMSSTFPGMWFEIKVGKMGGVTQPYVYWNRGFVNGYEITGNYGLSVWGQI